MKISIKLVKRKNNIKEKGQQSFLCFFSKLIDVDKTLETLFLKQDTNTVFDIINVRWTSLKFYTHYTNHRGNFKELHENKFENPDE